MDDSPASPCPAAVASDIGNPAPPREEGRLGTVCAAGLFSAFLVLLAWLAPFLLAHWRRMEAVSDAECRFLMRQAELKAEAVHADERLNLLDRRLHITALGFREVVRKVARQVVSVANCRDAKSNKGKKRADSDSPISPNYIQNGVGAGVIVKPGYILTNHHVVKDADHLLVTFASGQTLELDLNAVSSDALTDLAVIRLPEELPKHLQDDSAVTAVFADSDRDVEVGDWVIAVGSPLGLRHTVTQGIISAKGRLLSMLDGVELLQTDAAINPGNSGGPLFDQLGRVAGINVAIASDNGTNQGIGFAIPGNTARRIFEELAAGGHVVRGHLGAILEEMTDAPKLEGKGGAVLIAEILANRSADQAGLKVNDVIIGFAGRPLSEAQPLRDLRERIFATPPGREVALEIIRAGERRVVEVRMGQRPGR